MCVTNIAKSRNVALSGSQAAASRAPSLISQRLMGNFLPLMMKNAQVAKSLPVTVSTNVDTPGSGCATSLYREEQHPYINVPQEKKHPKRRRKPQKPGKTAKLNDRHFVVHNYHDHAWVPDESDCEDDTPRRGGVAVSFPARLHDVLDRVEREGWGHVISWQPHGRCFLIHNPHDFQEHVLPVYFGQSKLTSFQRQLNLYGFCRLTRGTDAGAYYHELFLRGKFFLTKRMLRTKIKGTKFKASSNPEHEPDFYSMVRTVLLRSSCVIFSSVANCAEYSLHLLLVDSSLARWPSANQR
jgi:HSF-type DNA-binding